MTIPKEKNEILTPWLDINGNELRIGLRWNDARDEITLIAYDDNDHTCSYEASAWELLAITEHGAIFAGDLPDLGIALDAYDRIKVLRSAYKTQTMQWKN